MLEFEQGTDMNAVSIEMSNTIDQIKGSLPENSGTPVMMQITPDMLPVLVASVDVDGKDAKEVSQYVDDELLPAFERLDGVASVSTTGLITPEVQVVLDQSKIDAVNDRVLAAVDQNLADAKKQLDDSQSQLDDAKAQLNAGKSKLDSSEDAASKQLAQASAQVDAATAQLQALLSQETTLKANQAAYQAEQKALQQYADMNDSVNMLAVMVVAYDFTGTVPEINGVPSMEDLAAMAQNSAKMLEALKDPATYIDSMSDENYAKAMQAVQDMMQKIAPEQDLSQMLSLSRADFVKLVQTTAYAAQRVQEITASLNDVNTQLTAAEAMKPQLQQALDEANAAYEKVEAGKMNATLNIAEGATEISVGKASLENAQKQLDSAVDEFEKSRDQAYKSADISGIITADMISKILIAENFEMPAGYISDSNDNSYVLKVGEKYDSADDLSNMVLFHMDTGDIGDIHLSDVAEVKYADQNADTSYAKVNGNDAVVLSFSKQSTASTSEVSDAIREKIDEFQQNNSKLHITSLMDQGDYIHLIVSSVLSNLIYGGLLAVLVLIVFLRDIRPTVIIAFSIPLSVLFAVVLMYFSNMTLNIISLSGLALGVGMLVDNSIVVIENIYRLRNLGVPAAKAAVQGAAQMSGAIFASTLTTVCVFLPIVFTQGITKQLFADMGLTIACLFAVRIVYRRADRRSGDECNADEKGKSCHARAVRRLVCEDMREVLRWCLSHRAVTLLAVTALLVLSVAATVAKGVIFIPSMSSEQMSATMTMPAGSDDTETRAMADQAMKIMRKVDGVKTVGAMTGGSDMTSMMSTNANSVSFYLILDKGADNEAIANEIAKKTKKLDCEMNVSASNMDLGSYMGSGVQVDIYGNNLDQLQTVSADIAEKLKKVDGLKDISDGNEDPDREKVITVNKDAAMEQGLTVAQVYQALADKLTTEVNSTTLTVGTEDLPVVVKGAVQHHHG